MTLVSCENCHSVYAFTRDEKPMQLCPNCENGPFGRWYWIVEP